MSDHAKLSPSESHRWFACPGSVKMCAGTERRGNAAARMGTGAHSIAEKIMSATGLWKKAKTYVGKKHKFKDGDENVDMIVSDETAQAVQVLLDHVLKVLADHPGAKLLLEQRSDLSHIRPNMFGTADVVVLHQIARSPRKLRVIDFKHGFTPVKLYEDIKPLLFGQTIANLAKSGVNTQLLMYAAGIAHEHRWEFDEIIIEIVQPRCFEVDDVQTLVLSPGLVREWMEDMLFERACATEMSDAPLVAGEHCRWCQAVSRCPAVHLYVNALAKSDFDTGDIPAVPSDPDMIARILKAAPMIDAWIRAANEAAFELMSRGTAVPGFKLVRKKTNREWPTADPKKLLALLCKNGAKLKQADLFHTPELKSPAQLEKIATAKIVSAVAVKPDGGLTLAAESDKREAAVMTKAADDFADLI